MLKESAFELSEYISIQQARAFGKMLKEARTQRGKTQEEVAKDIGLSQNFVSGAERLSPASGIRFLETLLLLRYYNIEPNEAARILGLAGPWAEHKETPDHQ